MRSGKDRGERGMDGGNELDRGERMRGAGGREGEERRE